MDNTSPPSLQQEPTYLEPTVILRRLTLAQSARMFPRRNNDDPRLDHMGRRLRRMTDYSYPYMRPSRCLDYDYGEPTVVIPKLNLPPGVEQPRDLVHLVYKTPPLPPPTAATEELQLPMQDEATKVVCLTNMLPAPHRLEDDDFYDRFVDDVEVEACEYGQLVKLIVPRPNDAAHPAGGLAAVGKVFLQYACLDGSNVCQAMMDRCLWKGGEEIIAQFYPEDKFAAGDYMALENKLIHPDDRNPTRRSPVLSPNYQRRVASVPGKKLTRLDPF